jgi:hypothetical protein
MQIRYFTLGAAMRFKNYSVVLASLLILCTLGHADFKYTEKTQITGGALMSMTKMAGVFSKDARHSMDPTTRTVAIKGNKTRTDESDGKTEIIDLDGRRFIRIDPTTQSYSITTFDDMKKAMEQKQAEMQQKMKEEQAKHPNQPQPANMKITPKFQSTETGATKDILGVHTKELKATVEMLMESTDPKTQGQQVSTVIHTDQWIAPDVPNYTEIRDFYLKMAKELDWAPGQMMGTMANSNIQLSLSEVRKSNLAHISGMPMLSYMSMTMAANGNDPNAAAAQQPPSQQPTQTQSQDNSIPTSPNAAVMKGLGSMFGHKKDKQGDANSGAPAANPASTPGSMMDMQTEVTTYSSDSLDASLFGPPAGYTQKQVTADDMMKSKH